MGDGGIGRVNGKLKCKETIDKIVKGEKIHPTTEELSGIIRVQMCIHRRGCFYRAKHGRGARGIPRSHGVEARCWQIVGKFGYKESNGTGWSVRLDTTGM